MCIKRRVKNEITRNKVREMVNHYGESDTSKTIDKR